MNIELMNNILSEVLIERFEQVAIEKEPDIDLERAMTEEDGEFYVDPRTDCLFLGFSSGYENRCQETNFDMVELVDEYNNKTIWH